MRNCKLLLSIALGASVVVGLLAALGSQGQSAQAAPSATPAAVDHGDVISQALDYVGGLQNEDGGLPWFGADSDARPTARGVLALVAAGRPAQWMAHPTTGATLVDYLETQAVTYTHEITGATSDLIMPAEAGLLLMAVSAANEDPTTFGGMDLVAQLESTYHPDTGAYSTTHKPASDLNQAWSILGLAAAGQPVPLTATHFLTDLQAPDGSWAAYGMSDLDTTGAAVLALIGSGNVGPTDPSIQMALDHLRDTQLPNGGWRPFWDTDPANPNSTAWAIQALVAAGYTPATESWAAPDGTPQDALVSLQGPDGRIGGLYANAHSTAEAIFGLTEAPLTFLGREIRALRALTWMNEGQNTDGSWSSWSGPDPGPTCDAVLAYAAAGYDPATVMAAGSVTSAMDYLSATASVFAADAASKAGKLALTVQAAGRDARDFGGVNIVHVLTDTWYSPTLGAFGVPTNTYDQAFSMLGLAAAGQAVPVSATQNLTGMQQLDGGWKFDTSDQVWNTTGPDHTGLALQALIAAGVPADDPSIQDGLVFLQAQQDASGGWSYWASPSPNSTAYAIQGALAGGADLESDPWLRNGHSPFNALAAMQKVDGPFAQNGTDTGIGTWQAVPALLGGSYPLSPGGLEPFQPVERGPDPDRMVQAAPRASMGASVTLVAPFGSDLNGNGGVTVRWRIDGGAWQVATVDRADGAFTGTIATRDPGVYDLQAIYLDPDGVQGENVITSTGVLTIHQVLLPVVSRGN